jgi:hypothetical protein
VTEPSTEKGKIEQYIDTAKKHLKQMDKIALSCYLKDASPRHFKMIYNDRELQSRLNMLKHHKKLVVEGGHVVSLTSETTPNILPSLPLKEKKKYRPYRRQTVHKERSVTEGIQKSLAEVQIPQSTKAYKKSDLEALLNQYCTEQLVSEHIVCKVERWVEFCDFVARTYNCKLVR